MDEIDQTTERMEAEEARRRQLFRPVEIPAGTGKCLFCEEEVEGNRRWCDKECADGYEQELKRKKPPASR